MKTKILAWVMCCLLVLTTVSALYGISYDTYSGQAARERRSTFDPYSRERYFGEGHVQTFGGFGSKGPVTGTLVGTGKKSAYSGTFNLDTDEFWRRSRSPGRISNWDPRVRGFSRMDVAVPLYPYSFVERDYPTGAATGINHLSKGTARVLSLSNSFNSAFYTREQGNVHMKLRELPPVSKEELFEAWLVDDDSEYFLSMGLFNTGISGTASVDFSINRPLIGYDRIVVTKEVFPDRDPRPSNNVVLVGEIETPRSAGPPRPQEVAIR